MTGTCVKGDVPAWLSQAPGKLAGSLPPVMAFGCPEKDSEIDGTSNGEGMSREIPGALVPMVELILKQWFMTFHRPAC
jgi:hypothetical protein